MGMSSIILQNKLTVEQLKKAKAVKYSYPYLSSSSNTCVVEEYAPKNSDEVTYKRYKENIITGEKKIDVSDSIDIYQALNKINGAIPQVTVRYYYKPKTATLNGRKTTARKSDVWKSATRKPATRKPTRK